MRLKSLGSRDVVYIRMHYAPLGIRLPHPAVFAGRRRVEVAISPAREIVHPGDLHRPARSFGSIDVSPCSRGSTGWDAHDAPMRLSGAGRDRSHRITLRHMESANWRGGGRGGGGTLSQRRHPS
jgi:hypothetical protein